MPSKNKSLENLSCYLCRQPKPAVIYLRDKSGDHESAKSVLTSGPTQTKSGQKSKATAVPKRPNNLFREANQCTHAFLLCRFMCKKGATTLPHNSLNTRYNWHYDVVSARLDVDLLKLRF